MSGHCRHGLEKLHLYMAIYMYCCAHCLNLISVDSTKNVREAAEFFALMETLYVLNLTTKAHSIYYVKQQTVLYLSKPVCQLQCLSDTR